MGYCGYGRRSRRCKRYARTRVAEVRAKALRARLLSTRITARRADGMRARLRPPPPPPSADRQIAPLRPHAAAKITPNVGGFPSASASLLSLREDCDTPRPLRVRSALERSVRAVFVSVCARVRVATPPRALIEQAGGKVVRGSQKTTPKGRCCAFFDRNCGFSALGFFRVLSFPRCWFFHHYGCYHHHGYDSPVLRR